MTNSQTDENRVSATEILGSAKNEYTQICSGKTSAHTDKKSLDYTTVIFPLCLLPAFIVFCHTLSYLHIVYIGDFAFRHSVLYCTI